MTGKEKMNKDYWRNVFSTMAERNRQKNGSKIVLGADRHKERMRKSRVTEIVGTPAKLGRTRPPPAGETRNEVVTPTTKVEGNPTIKLGEFKKERASNREGDEVTKWLEDNTPAKEDSDEPPFKEYRPALD